MICGINYVIFDWIMSWAYLTRYTTCYLGKNRMPIEIPDSRGLIAQQQYALHFY